MFQSLSHRALLGAQYGDHPLQRPPSRILLLVHGGLLLSAAGAAYQGFFKTPWPLRTFWGYQGFGLRRLLAIIAGMGTRATMVSAFLFGVVTVALVWLVSSRAKASGVMSLILAGIVVSSIFEAGPPISSWWPIPMRLCRKSPTGSWAACRGQNGRGGLRLRAHAGGASGPLSPALAAGGPHHGGRGGQGNGRQRQAVRLIVILGRHPHHRRGRGGVRGHRLGGAGDPHLCRKLVGSNYRYLMPASMVLGPSSSSLWTIFPATSTPPSCPSASSPPSWARPSSST